MSKTQANTAICQAQTTWMEKSVDQSTFERDLQNDTGHQQKGI